MKHWNHNTSHINISNNFQENFKIQENTFVFSTNTYSTYFILLYCFSFGEKLKIIQLLESNKNTPRHIAVQYDHFFNKFVDTRYCAFPKELYYLNLFVRLLYFVLKVNLYIPTNYRNLNYLIDLYYLLNIFILLKKLLYHLKK